MCRMVLFLFLPLALFASTEDTVQHRNSVGAYVESNILFAGYGNYQMQSAGLVFKTQIHQFVQLTSSFSLSDYTHYPLSIRGRQTSLDTIPYYATNTTARLISAGFGMEAKRKFYRRVLLTAGAEIRYGYGHGKKELVTKKEFRLNNMPVSGYPGGLWATSETTEISQAITKSYLAITPYLGAEIAFPRIVFGLKFMNYWGWQRTVSLGGDNETFFDIAPANIFHQWYVLYRF